MEVAALGASLLVVAGFFQLGDGIQVVAAGALRGLKDTRVPMLFAALGYWGIGLPFGLLVAHGGGFGPRGIWFGLGVWSKVALGFTLVFFIVFFNVYQGVREVSPSVLANARMLGASQGQLLRHVYLPSATSWVFSSLHNSVGLAFVGAVVGEYLGSARGVGYLILQAEGTFDINTVFAGVVVLTLFALVLDAVVGVVEKRLMKWQPRQGETEKL